MNQSNSLTRTQALARGALLLASGLVLLFGTSAGFVGEGTPHEDAVIIEHDPVRARGALASIESTGSCLAPWSWSACLS